MSFSNALIRLSLSQLASDLCGLSKHTTALQLMSLIVSIIQKRSKFLSPASILLCIMRANFIPS